MATQKIWNLKYVAGNPQTHRKIRSDASNPFKRSDALAAAQKIADFNWRVWVEHSVTEERIYESEVEANYLNGVA